jgi:hypothetical protein
MKQDEVFICFYICEYILAVFSVRQVCHIFKSRTMKRHKLYGNKPVAASNKITGAKNMSRRKVIKTLVLAPVGLSLLNVTKARGLSGMSPDGKGLHGDFNPYTPNQPMGKGQGIMPGRVSWVWNPEATNPGCANLPVSGDITEDKYNAWFMDKNTNQEIVDRMIKDGLCSIAGKNDIGEAWNAIFRYQNLKQRKGNVTYSKGEKIYLKLNRTAASSAINKEYERQKDKLLTLSCETSPQVVLSMLRQLVNVAGVPQNCIYVGDTMRNLYQDEYLKYHAEFPEVNYLSSFGDTSGRIRAVVSDKDLIFYSDKKSVMGEAGSDKMYTVLEDAEYLINIPVMKGHNLAGITLCAKNHFGTQARPRAAHLHPGLNTDSSRKGYGYYRVLVDIMGNKYTGGKNLFYMLDALWSGDNWNGLPVKFLMPPFNNHWCSSLLFSLDPVAIESVAVDFLRTEFTEPEHTVEYISAAGVDDYLHQAADPKNWPAGIVYSPNGDNVPMPGLGVHEHWNNPVDKQYSRNLDKGEGIELVKIFQKG